MDPLHSSSYCSFYLPKNYGISIFFPQLTKITVVSIHVNKSNLTRHLFTHILLRISFSSSFTLTFNFATFLSCLLTSSSYASLCCSATLILFRSPGMISVDRLHISLSIHCQNLQPPSAHTANLRPGFLEVHEVMTLDIFSHLHNGKSGLLVSRMLPVQQLLWLQLSFSLFKFRKKSHFTKWMTALYGQKCPSYFGVLLTWS